MVLYHNVFSWMRQGISHSRLYSWGRPWTSNPSCLQFWVLNPGLPGCKQVLYKLSHPATFWNPPLQFPRTIISIQSVYLLKDRDDSVHSEAFLCHSRFSQHKGEPLKQGQAFIPLTKSMDADTHKCRHKRNEGRSISCIFLVWYFVLSPRSNGRQRSWIIHRPALLLTHTTNEAEL